MLGKMAPSAASTAMPFAGAEGGRAVGARGPNIAIVGRGSLFRLTFGPCEIRAPLVNEGSSPANNVTNFLDGGGAVPCADLAAGRQERTSVENLWRSNTV